jgi:hypothetical protein
VALELGRTFVLTNTNQSEKQSESGVLNDDFIHSLFVSHSHSFSYFFMLFLNKSSNSLNQSEKQSESGVLNADFFIHSVSVSLSI